MILSAGAPGDRDFRGMLTGLEKYTQWYIPGVFPTELVEQFDLRARSEELQAAMKRETQGLWQRGRFENANIDDLPPNANILSSQFVLTPKHFGTPMEQHKACLVAQGYTDSEKLNLCLWQRCTKTFFAVYNFKFCWDYGFWDMVSGCASSIHKKCRATKLRDVPETIKAIEISWQDLMEIC